MLFWNIFEEILFCIVKSAMQNIEIQGSIFLGLDTMDPTQYLAKITPDHGGTPYYQCTFCEYNTQYCTSAKRHIASKHVVLFSHKCSRCEKSFSTQNAYNQHMKRYCMNPNIVT